MKVLCFTGLLFFFCVGLSWECGVNARSQCGCLSGDLETHLCAALYIRCSQRRGLANRRAQTPNPMSSSGHPNRSEIIRNLRAEIAAQKSVNRRLLSREIQRIETLMQSQREQRP